MISNLQFFEIDGGMVELMDEIGESNPTGEVRYSRSDILGEYDYIIVDGTLPTSPSENAENIIKAIRVLAESGAAQTWDMDKFVERLVESFGFEDVEQWKKAPQQVVPDDQIQQELQAGNIVPMQQAQEQMAAQMGQAPIGPEVPPQQPAEVI